MKATEQSFLLVQRNFLTYIYNHAKWIISQSPTLFWRVCAKIFAKVEPLTCHSWLFVFLKDRWKKLNSDPVCFSARDERPGRFYVPRGNLAAIKLVHLYGYVTCATQNSNSWSYWGCWIPVVRYHVGVAITTSSSYRVILPLSRFIAPSGDSGLRLRKWSRIPGYTGMSSSLVLSFGDAPYYSSGETFRLWYGEDLADSTESNNAGRTCADVYGRFV